MLLSMMWKSTALIDIHWPAQISLLMPLMGKPPSQTTTALAIYSMRDSMLLKIAALPWPKWTDSFCESSSGSSFLTRSGGSGSADVESCLWITGDMVPVADEIIDRLRLRWKMGETTEATVSHAVADLLHSAKIIPTPTPAAAQLCVVTQRDTSGNRSRSKKSSSDYFSDDQTSFFCWQRDREWQERDGTKRGQWGGEGVGSCLNGITLRWGHASQRSLNPILQSFDIPQISLDKRIWISQAHTMFFSCCPESISYIIVISCQLLAWRDIVLSIYLYSCTKWEKKEIKRLGKTKACIFSGFPQ